LYYAIVMNDGSYIEHHGILGQKWGIRRYQNEDGSLTELGKKRYAKGMQEMTRKAAGKVARLRKKNGDPDGVYVTEVKGLENKLNPNVWTLEDRHKASSWVGSAVGVGAASTMAAMAVIGAAPIATYAAGVGLVSIGSVAANKALDKIGMVYSNDLKDYSQSVEIKDADKLYAKMKGRA